MSMAMSICDIEEKDIIDAFLNMSHGTKGGVSLEFLWNMPIDRYLFLINRYNAFANKKT